MIQRQRHLDAVYRFAPAHEERAGVVHQHIQPRVAPQELFHQPANLRLRREIGHQQVHAIVAGGPLDVVHRRRAPRGVARYQHRGGAAVRQRLRCHTPDPRGRPRHQAHLVLHLIRHGSRLLIPPSALAPPRHQTGGRIAGFSIAMRQPAPREMIAVNGSLGATTQRAAPCLPPQCIVSPRPLARTGRLVTQRFPTWAARPAADGRWRPLATSTQWGYRIGGRHARGGVGASAHGRRRREAA